MSLVAERLKQILEGALLAAARPLSIDDLLNLFADEEKPARGDVRAALDELAADLEGRAAELKEVASGYRLQVRSEFAPWVSRLWEERPARYSRALLETLALVAYRQPITRGEIEDVRGVSVSTNIVKTLLERGWVRIVGHRDVPGRPAMYGTTREFLDYFGLSSLDELPTLSALRDIDSINVELDFDGEGEAASRDTGADEPAELDSEFEVEFGDRSEAEAETEAETEAADGAVRDV